MWGVRCGLGMWAMAVFAIAPPSSAEVDSAPADTTLEVKWRVIAQQPEWKPAWIVRGSWIAHEPASKESTYVGYRIESRDGRLWASDTLPSFRDGFHGDACELSCRVGRYASGLVAAFEAECWPCYPDVCTRRQYVVVRGDGSVARSDWTEVQWDPARGDSASVWIEKGCGAYRVPLVARVQRDRIVFAVRRPEGVPESGAFVVPASLGPCIVPDEAQRVRSVGVFTGAESRTLRRIALQPGDAFQVLGALVRANQDSSGAFSLEVLRVEVQLGRTRGFAHADVLSELGYQQP